MDPPPVQPSIPREQVMSAHAAPVEETPKLLPVEQPKTVNSPSQPSGDTANSPQVQNAYPPEDSDPDAQNVNSTDVAELTAQIMEMISKEDNETNMNQTGLLKKNVELQEFLVKLIELLREKTNLCANLERQNSALTNQAKSLRDVINITKDLLNIRNMEVEHLHVDMGTMEKCIKEERERHNLAIQRLSEAMTLNDKLKTEYLNQMGLFGKLRDKYNEKVALLMKENQNLKELVKGSSSMNGPTATESIVPEPMVPQSIVPEPVVPEPILPGPIVPESNRTKPIEPEPVVPESIITKPIEPFSQEITETIVVAIEDQN